MAKTTLHMDYYPGGSIMPGRSFSSNSYRFGYNAGSEKDDEIFGTTGSAYHTYFRELDTRINRWWSVDPVFQPWQSPYCSMDGNPIRLNDPRGDDVDPTASGYNEAKNRATPILKKDGTINMKKSLRNGYEPEFAKIFNEFENNHDIMVKFEHIGDEAKEGGTISFVGKNDEGQKIYSAKWNPSLTKELGASGLFEEAFHLKEALEGKEMAFPDKPNSGVMGLDIYDEVRAKKWVANNINATQSKYSLGNNYLGYTHYGYIKLKLSSDEKIANKLMNGVTQQAGFLDPKYSLGSGASFGVVTGVNYMPFGFGGDGYKKMSSVPKKP